MKSTLVVTSALCLLIIFTVAFTVKDQPGYKNLKVLPKNITKERLDSVMHHFNKSLNVKCSFCHVRFEDGRKWDFANDSIGEKSTARKMMLMTIDINKKYFLLEDKNATEIVQSVTCYTCHRGAVIPPALPPPVQNQQGWQPPAEKQ